MHRAQETVYLSFGTPANYVAAHFWNTQQSYFDYRSDAPPPLVEHDVSFKAGIGADGLDTYSPRAMLFDVREEFGALRRINALYETDEDAEFDGPVIQTEPRVSPLSAADEHAAPRFWTDIAQTLFHPKSLLPVSAPSIYGHTFLSNMGTDTQNPTLDTFAQGQAIARAMEQDHGMFEDTLRWWTEDTDLMQGFQLSASMHDAYGGIVCTYLDMLADEYPKTERHLTLLSQRMEHNEKLTPYTMMNQALSLAHALDYAHLLTPIGLEAPPSSRWPHVRAEPTCMSETSAIVAALYETATLPLRLARRTESMYSFRTRLNWRGDTPISQLGGCLPTPLLADERHTDPLDILMQSMLARRHGKESIIHKDTAEEASKRLAAAWWDASLPVATFYQSKCKASSADTLAANPASNPVASTIPYAECFVARDADANAEKPTIDALAYDEQLPEPLVTRYVIAENFVSLTLIAEPLFRWPTLLIRNLQPCSTEQRRMDGPGHTTTMVIMRHA